MDTNKVYYYNVNHQVLWMTWSTNNYYRMDESWKHQAKWKKLKTKDHILYQSMYMKCSEYVDNKERKILVNSAGKDFWESLERQEDKANQS